jgi:TrmH family RNA methyltransferase
MISNNQIKFVKSLHQKKFRLEHGLYIAEGRKMLAEAMASQAPIQTIYSVDEDLMTDQIESHHINQSELERISALKTPQDVLFVVQQPNPLSLSDLPKGLCIVLDRVRDPGNLGTIIRTADWFGAAAIVQSTMGSLFRMPIIIAEIADAINTAGSLEKQILVADMNGVAPGEVSMADDCLLLIGNEAQGVDPKLVTEDCTRVSIKSFGGAESLNASIACAIICYEHRRSR